MSASEMSPAEDRAYRSGWNAYKRGKALHENPHHCATNRAADKYWAWFRGYEHAKEQAAQGE